MKFKIINTLISIPCSPFPINYHTAALRIQTYNFNFCSFYHKIMTKPSFTCASFVLVDSLMAASHLCFSPIFFLKFVNLVSFLHLTHWYFLLFLVCLSIIYTLVHRLPLYYWSHHIYAFSHIFL